MEFGLPYLACLHGVLNVNGFALLISRRSRFSARWYAPALVAAVFCRGFPRQRWGFLDPWRYATYITYETLPFLAWAAVDDMYCSMHAGIAVDWIRPRNDEAACARLLCVMMPLPGTLSAMRIKQKLVARAGLLDFQVYALAGGSLDVRYSAPLWG